MKPTVPMRVLILAIVLTGGCLAQVSAGHSPILQFEDIGKRAGVAVPHISSPEKSYIIESMFPAETAKNSRGRPKRRHGSADFQSG